MKRLLRAAALASLPLMLVATMTASSQAQAGQAQDTNSAGLTAEQVSVLDRVLVGMHVPAAQRQDIETHRDKAQLIGVETQQGGGKPSLGPVVKAAAPTASPSNWGRCDYGGSYQVVTWDPYIYQLNIIRQRLWTETHHLKWCVNYPRHDWVTWVQTPAIESSVTWLGGLGGWTYDGVIYGPQGASYEYISPWGWSGFWIYERTKWHQCTAKIGCIQTMTPWTKAYEHSNITASWYSGV